MTDQELLQLNREGFIPGPEETESLFLQRVEKTKERFQEKSWIPRAHWDWARLRVKELFDFEPDWLPVFYSNRGLAPWEGAASWIEGRSIQSIQLRDGLKKGRYLTIYERDEILAHEAVHGARSAFHEEGNEEFFAYMTSDKKWRRVLGPMVKRPWEIGPFLFLGLGGVGCQWAGIYWSNGEIASKICFLAACFWIVLGFWRLIRHHLILKKASKAALHWVKDSAKARALLFRLTDQEIKLFSQGADIKEYAERQSCLRWKLIRLAYL